MIMSHKKVALFFLLGIVGCSKNSTNYDIATGMRFQVGAKAFQSIQYGAVAYPYYYQIDGTGIINGDTVTLTLYVVTPVVVNQKISTDNTALAEIDYEIRSNNTPFATYSAFQGQKGPAYYTVTAIDTIRRTIQGTFSGMLAQNGSVTGAADSIVITNGQFNSSY